MTLPTFVLTINDIPARIELHADSDAHRWYCDGVDMEVSGATVAEAWTALLRTHAALDGLADAYQEWLADQRPLNLADLTTLRRDPTIAAGLTLARKAGRLLARADGFDSDGAPRTAHDLRRRAEWDRGGAKFAFDFARRFPRAVR